MKFISNNNVKIIIENNATYYLINNVFQLRLYFLIN